MATKDRLLRLLENRRERFVSGEVLARELGVSRNAVWKAVGLLRAEGYAVEAVTNRGYRLAQENDVLSPQSIEHFLPEEHPFTISVRKRVDSTNAEARRRALEGAPEGTVVVAEEQTAGRGRRGKSFFSPAETGLYLSVLLRPSLAADQAHYLTCAAAVAGARAIEHVTGRAVLIKWVNDLYCDGRKVAGILTEGVVDMESGLLDHAVLGIGINVKPPHEGFPTTLDDTAGTVCDEQVGAIRSELAAAVLQHFWSLYQQKDSQPFYEEYRKRCFLIGQNVVVTRNNSRVRARAVDLTHDFKLVVELPNKTRLELPYGEVSTRPLPPAALGRNAENS
ncbi:MULTISPECIES: biotin--[acetyl-CoA-carboxylase] ligase [Gordonibacter]|uniref:Bifunctional ligase/repressor BirA n=1 Tax=Gordonibacter faecis TaxID=3047475 RepID=A0ABT7DJU7_9ACTN|nr:MULTISPECIES: biotin--[acetyl-CoA-carboxylase] ligase [unclassified Gordonibacter]MDJ1649791.1 biotin--[acetyl-CoA-carboxylase] ligase [Gordonibacter sp. KGMB12511]HIW75456.1 biotin--[acetyl-CoA-carboxylase] ligase [Candidatus Gordonibacter avicola]